MKTIEE